MPAWDYESCHAASAVGAGADLEVEGDDVVFVPEEPSPALGCSCLAPVGEVLVQVTDEPRVVLVGPVRELLDVDEDLEAVHCGGHGVALAPWVAATLVLVDMGEEAVDGDDEVVERLEVVAEGDELEQEVVGVDEDLDLDLDEHEACVDCLHLGAGVDIVHGLVDELIVLELVAMKLEEPVATDDCLVELPR